MRLCEIGFMVDFLWDLGDCETERWSNWSTKLGAREPLEERDFSFDDF